MTMYQAYCDFTAQSWNISALMALYADLKGKEKPQIELTPIVVFMAFSIESYLNSLGARHIEIWDELERLPWKSKVRILHKAAGASVDWGSEPLQFATEVFKVRDKLAHGKPERVIGPMVKDMKSAYYLSISDELQPEWFQGVTREWALNAKVRFRNLLVYLAKLFGEAEADHLSKSTAGVLTHDDEDV